MVLSIDAIRLKTKNYIKDNFFLGADKTDFNDSSSFLDTGIIDSTGVLELINFMQEEFKIELLDEEMLPENLDSINNIVSFVERKLIKQ